MNFYKKLVSVLLVVSGWMLVPIPDRAYSQAGAVTKDAKIVSNPSEPVPAKGRRQRIVFKEDLTIGVAEGDENYMFGKSVQVTADEKGSIYALDWDRKRIQKYDDQGKFLFSIGREGQGPGEFRNIWEMRFDGKGRIYATDISNKRVSFFNKENGRFEEAIRTEMNIGAVILLPNGTYFSSKNIQDVKGDAVSWSNTFGLYDKDFKPLAELHRQRLDYGALGNLSNRAQFFGPNHEPERLPSVPFFGRHGQRTDHHRISGDIRDQDL